MFEGYSKRYRVKPLDMCGTQFTAFMQREFLRGAKPGVELSLQAAEAMKRDVCVGTPDTVHVPQRFRSSFWAAHIIDPSLASAVSLDFERDVALCSTTNVLEERFTLPDGAAVTVSKERITVPELMFQPSLRPKYWPDSKLPIPPQASRCCCC